MPTRIGNLSDSIPFDPLAKSKQELWLMVETGTDSTGLMPFIWLVSL
jgi:hypothetical protein